MQVCLNCGFESEDDVDFCKCDTPLEGVKRSKVEPRAKPKAKEKTTK